MRGPNIIIALKLRNIIKLPVYINIIIIICICILLLIRILYNMGILVVIIALLCVNIKPFRIIEIYRIYRTSLKRILMLSSPYQRFPRYLLRLRIYSTIKIHRYMAWKWLILIIIHIIFPISRQLLQIIWCIQYLIPILKFLPRIFHILLHTLLYLSYIAIFKL